MDMTPLPFIDLMGTSHDKSNAARVDSMTPPPFIDLRMGMSHDKSNAARVCYFMG
jgi:hypothetical protein